MMIATPSRIKPPVAAGLSQAHPLADRLVGCWLLNEGTGQIVRDTSGHHRDGSFSGGPLWQPGAFGWAVDFDGNDDWISMGNCLDLGTDDVTVLALVQYSAADQPEQSEGDHIAAIAGKGYLSSSSGYGLSVGAGNKICWQVRNQSTLFSIASDSALNDGRWHVVAAVCDRDNPTGVRLYIDGVRQSATADPTSIAAINLTGPMAFAIGSRQDSSLTWAWDFLGRVAVVSVWKRVLTEAEIGQLCREPFAVFARRRRVAPAPRRAPPAYPNVDLVQTLSLLENLQTKTAGTAQMTAGRWDAPTMRALDERLLDVYDRCRLLQEALAEAEVNRALGQVATASSSEPGLGPEAAVDGSDTTRWSSQAADEQWLAVDLGVFYRLARAVLRWDTGHAAIWQLEIETAPDVWVCIYRNEACVGGVEEVVLDEGWPPARHTRMHGLTRAGAEGFSLWEFELYGEPV